MKDAPLKQGKEEYVPSTVWGGMVHLERNTLAAMKDVPTKSSREECV
jgi:hypothetical protein